MTRLLFTAAAIATLAACTVGSDSEAPLSYQEFNAKFIGNSGGHLYYDWDVPLRSEDQVKKLYASYLRAKKNGEQVSAATVATDLFGDRTVWSANEAQNLSYCVSDSFGASKGAVVAAMNKATGDWATASNGRVKFVYQNQYDANCNAGTPTVFDVNPGTIVYARAFFPDYPRADRNVLISPETFNGDYPAAGILRHELGHTLGLRHETARLEGILGYGIQCFEDLFFEPLTDFDDYSIMTTPACMGDELKNTALTISSLDVQGIRELYP